MKLLLKRLDISELGIFGHLSTEDFDCVTLERHDLAIPAGNYRVTLYQSPTHGLVPLLHGVPGRDMIEIHEGNYEWNSKGCILVGAKRVGTTIETSRATLKTLVDKMKPIDDIWINIL